MGAQLEKNEKGVAELKARLKYDLDDVQTWDSWDQNAELKRKYGLYGDAQIQTRRRKLDKAAELVEKSNLIEKITDLELKQEEILGILSDV